MAMLIRQLSNVDRGCQFIALLSLHRIIRDVRYFVPLPSQVPRWLVGIVRSIQEECSTGARLATPLVGQYTSGFLEQRLYTPASAMLETPNSQ